MRRALLLLLVVVLAACREKDPVAKTIAEIADAADDRDAGAVLEHLSSHYSDANGDRREVEAMLRRYFFAYRAIDVTVQRMETTHSASSGRATFRVLFIGQPKSIGGMDQFLPRTATYDFDVWLELEDGKWKATTAQWREVTAQ
ncbi:MAG TPA: hypothetical protein VJZ00_11350 [Thermoanaerobaculia bacterium]|nr:hypothetical protein [Thermoanaerobaculia bacterium]